MQFVYHPNAGVQTLSVDIREYEHIFKVRRMSVGEKLQWRNLKDVFLYEYEISTIGKKEAELDLIDKKEGPLLPSKILHVGWSIIDPKIIEKTLPMLNELGVSKISFVYAEFSQKSHKLDLERMKRILINSSQQCGRSLLMQIEVFPTLQDYIVAYPKSYILDFSETKLNETEKISSILIGPEGGLSQKERMLLQNQSIVGLTCNTILRSETAVVAAASKILA
ncbi:ribosomal RNA small subunit methyltransferase E [Sulfurospirillum diekertiae]|uniref:Ribosomal RNA small subunit methyltransferase E n=1 Tax=Sulfurospirillum diekertiae TaxID=1854492 RepID=A0A290HNV7_9BACT|nr:16S rRNA (uracil(1498)-N(3))-methyltransferase [Sulfurospirillum diekertiae]ATB68324.1 ribosomal RNA small subunit methyltransferase E [Sulfurospirillum diekertiae]